jgi:hypothetical protein
MLAYYTGAWYYMEMIYSTKNLDEHKYVQVAENYYALYSEWLKMNDTARHLDLCACVAGRREQLMFTGQSTCAVRGIPRLNLFEMRPHCVSEVWRSSDIVHWNYGQRDSNAAVIDGLLVTSPIRTICDLAKFDDTDSILVSINHCLFNDMFSKERLMDEIEKQSGFKGKKVLTQVLKFATPKCESPLETIAWIALYDAGFVMPQQQVNIKDGQHFIGRVDMYWELRGRKIVLELDGRIKYKNGNDLFNRNGEDPFDLEKAREDKMLDLGYEMIRATWKTVKSGELVEKLKRRNIPMRRYTARKFPRNKK